MPIRNTRESAPSNTTGPRPPGVTRCDVNSPTYLRAASCVLRVATCARETASCGLPVSHTLARRLDWENILDLRDAVVRESIHFRDPG
eukprot:94377-Prorocentrum_minimum.AAC.4